MRKKLTPISYRGIGLNNVGIRSWFDYKDGTFDMPEHEPILVNRIGAFPSRVRSQPKEKTLPLKVTLLSRDVESGSKYLGQIFDPSFGLQYLIVEDDNKIQRQLQCEPRKIILENENDREWTVVLVAAKPIWESVIEKSVTISLYKNLIENDSFEDNTTTGWTKGGSNAIATSRDQHYFGDHSLVCVYVNDPILASYNFTAVGASAHRLSIWLYIPLIYTGTRLTLEANNFAGASGTLAVNANMGIRDKWQRLTLSFTPAGGDLVGDLQIAERGVAPTGTNDNKAIWLDDAQAQNQAGDVAFDLLNNGNYPSEPKIECDDIANKDRTMAWFRKREITYAWRSDLPAMGVASGTWLLELTGGLNTSAIIRVAGTTTTLTTPITSGQAMPFDITVASTTGFDNPGMLIIGPGTGTEEQFEATVLNATQFHLTRRALGGTVAAAHAAADTVQLSRMLKNGDDIAVFVDQKKILDEKIYLNGIDTTATKIWIEIADAPAKFAKLAISNAATAGFVELLLDRDDHGFNVGDFLLIDSAGGPRDFLLLQISGRTLFGDLSYRGAGGALTAGDKVFLARHHIVLLYSWSRAPARPTAPNPPLIDLALSTNIKWQWSSVYWADGNRRPGGWRRIRYPGSDAVKVNRLATKIGLDLNTAKARFADMDPTSTRPNFDALQFDSACGIKPAGTAITFDAKLDWPFGLQIIGRDLAGIDSLIATRLGHESGSFHQPPFTYTNQPEQPVNILQAAILRARNLIVTGIVADDVNETLAPALVNGTDAQRFSLDENTPVISIVTRVRQAVTGTLTLLVQINKQNSSGGLGNQVAAVLTGPAASALTGVLVEVCQFYGLSLPVLPPGEYFLPIYESAGSGDIEARRSSASLYQRGEQWTFNSTTGVYEEQALQDFWFAILSAIADNQEELLGYPRTAKELLVYNMAITFDDTTPRVPLATMQAENIAYYFDNQFKRENQDLRVSLFSDFQDGAVVINVPEKRVTMNVLAKYDFDLRQTLIASDEKWLTIPPGKSTIALRVPGNIVQEQYTLKYRDRWSL